MTGKDSPVTVHAQLWVNDRRFVLEPDQDLHGLRVRLEEASRSAGVFVDFTAADGCEVSVLVSPGAAIVLTVAPQTRNSPDYGDPVEYDEADFDFEMIGR